MSPIPNRYLAVALGCVVHGIVFLAIAWHTGNCSGWGRLVVDYWFSGLLLNVPPKAVVILLLVSWPLWVLPLKRVSGKRIALIVLPMALGGIAIGLGLFAILMFSIADSIR